MLQDRSIKEITIVLTLIIGGANLIGYCILYFSGHYDWPLFGLTSVILCFASIAFTYLLLKYLVNLIVSYKVKPIYKIISDTSKSKTVKAPGVDGEVQIEKIQEEVQKWSKDREDQITHLASLRDYRKNFVGNISHELKTPIFSIQGYLLTLLEGGLEDDHINLKYLRRAAVNADRLQRIVEDLEQINSLEAGSIHLDLEVFDIYELTRDVVEDLKFISEEEDVSIKVKKKSISPESRSVRADKNKVRQVLLNLLNNAVKHGEKGVTVTVSFFDIDDKVFVEIEDDGKGIEEQHLDHLFDRFYRADKSRNRKHGGSGLGLSIVKHILEAHDQTITVSSEVGKGSVFTFSLSKP